MDRGGQFFEVLLRVVRREHQDDDIAVRVFTFDVEVPEPVRERGARAHVGRDTVDGRFQGFVPHQNQSFGLHLCFDGIYTLRGLRKGRLSVFFDPFVAEVQRLENEVRGACGAKEAHRLTCGLFEALGSIRSDMEVPTSGQHRERLMCGVRAGVGAKRHGVSVLRQELQVCAVSIVHEQQRPVPVRGFRQTPDVQDVSKVVGRRHEHCGDRFVFPVQPFQLSLQSIRRDGTAA